jgi:hypothetical protein
MNETQLIRDVFRAGAIFAMHYLGGNIPPEQIEAECEIFIQKLIREDDDFPEDKNE